jgi:hypothetical protein
VTGTLGGQVKRRAFDWNRWQVDWWIGQKGPSLTLPQRGLISGDQWRE